MKYRFDFLGVVMFILGLTILIAIYSLFDSIQTFRVLQNEKEAWTIKCIEADGLPVHISSYVKGLGQGDVCVKISGKVDTK